MARFTQDRKISGTLAAAQDTVRVFSGGMKTVTFQFTAGLVGTVTFEATNDDAAAPAATAYDTILAEDVTAGTTAVTVVNPAAGQIFRINAAGIRTVQARVSAFTSGSAAVVANVTGV